jgi:hypothetical protein
LIRQTIQRLLLRLVSQPLGLQQNLEQFLLDLLLEMDTMQPMVELLAQPLSHIQPRFQGGRGQLLLA